jgi:hypothetical protein
MHRQFYGKRTSENKEKTGKSTELKKVGKIQYLKGHDINKMLPN